MAKKGFRIEVFWEETGTVNEGGMEDGRQIVIERRPTKQEMTRIEAALEDLLDKMGLRTKKRISKLKSLPIWSLEVGDRVRLKMNVRPNPGELGEVVELQPGKYVVRLDIYRHARIFGHYLRNELVKVKG